MVNPAAAASPAARIALGAAQFGLAYGITNQAGQTTPAEGRTILDLARGAGVDTIDTAIAYGTSEQRLGDLGMDGWRIVTKLPAVDREGGDVSGWVRASVEAALGRLHIARLYGLLLHDTGDLLGPDGPRLYEGLQDLKARGMVFRIGVSIYQPEELDAIASRYAIDLVQAPFNVFDRRLETSGWMARLKGMGVELHARSVFLQGVLLTQPESRPATFARWAAAFAAWDDWVSRTGQGRLQACLGLVLAEPAFDRVVLGVDSAAQLAEILRACVHPPTTMPPLALASTDLDLLHPFRWSAP